ncbi:ammonium transporter [Sphingomonas sp. LM7]|nr:ammonium transporter [Sphingomonas sp. LM7]
MVAVALGGSLARHLGYIDNETLTRVVIGLNGLMIAWTGNRMPKAFVPSIAAREVHRIGGWSLVLSGLVYAGLWAIAPIDVAVIGGCGAILAGIAVTIGYCLSLRAKAKSA